MQEEMAAHLSRAVQRLLARGLSVEQARKQAEREFGNLVYLQEQGRDARGARMIEELFSDLRYGWRVLRGSPGFSLTAVLTIALAIGGTTAMFTLADRALIRPLPVRDPAQLVFLDVVFTNDQGVGAPSYPSFERQRVQNRSFAGLSAFGVDHMPILIDGEPEQALVQIASGNYFDLLGVPAQLGRTLTPADEKLQPAVAVISHQYWQSRFGGSRDVLGKVITNDGRAITIVGVTPPDFVGLDPTSRVDIALPITVVGDWLLRDNTASWFDIIARLKPGVSAEQARAEASAIHHAFLADAVGLSEDRRRVEQMKLTDASHGETRLRSQLMRPIVLLLGLVALVLVIACANIANLLLARAAARQREIDIRTAIGAGRGRIVRQLLTESVLLFAIGAAAGVGLAALLGAIVEDFLAIGRMPIVLDLDLSFRALLFTAGLCLLAAVLCGLRPALRATRFTTLRARAGGGLPVSRALVILQVAAAIVVLVDGSLLVRTLRNLRSLDAGFSASGVLTLSARPLTELPDEASRDHLWNDVVNRIDELPGVRSAAVSVLTPLSGRDRARRISVPGFEAHDLGDLQVKLNLVSPSYFDAFRIPLRFGRVFSAADTRTAPKVAIINEAAARFYFGNRNPVGARINFGTADENDDREIVGVVADVKHRNLREAAPRFVYVPVAQALEPSTRLTLAVQTSGDPTTMLPAVRQAVHAIDSQILLSDVMTMDEQLDQSLLRERLLSSLSTAFGTLAIMLAMIGLYGLISYAVVRRRNEIGIRMALGATPAAIQRNTLTGASTMIAAGVAIGLPASLFAARAIRGMLFGVSSTDPLTIAGSLLLVAFIALTAAYIPARRAARIQPSIALTTE
jgi:predicted permease